MSPRSRERHRHRREDVASRLARITFHTASAIAALLLVVLAAGVRRFLIENTPLDHLAPHAASTGLILPSVALLTRLAPRSASFAARSLRCWPSARCKYMAGMTGPLWLLIVTIALLRER